MINHRVWTRLRILTVAFGILPWVAHAAGYYNVGAWFKTQSPKLKFTTSPQTLATTWQCSGATTIETDNASGVATNVGSNLTVNLPALSGFTYYSDSGCTTPITSATVASGTSSITFYFQAFSIGSFNVSASAAAYKSASQSETVSALIGYTWIGGTSASWSTGSNWTGGLVPGSGNDTYFDGNCTTNCSPALPASSITVTSLNIAPNYPGTIAQNGANSITTNSWTQAGGTFTGGSGTITINGTFTLNGGTFTSTSGTLTWAGNVGITGSPTFNHNSGAVTISAGFDATPTITPGSVTYNNVTIIGSHSTFDFGGGTMTIAGYLTLSPTSYNMLVNSCTFLVGGNVTTNAYATGGSATVQLTGNASGQTITGTGGSIPSLVIVAGTNPVTLSGTVAIKGNYIVTSAGTFTTTGSTLNLYANCCVTITVTPGSFSYNNVGFSGSTTAFDLGGNTMTIAGNLSLSPGNYGMTMNNGTLLLGGNLTTNAFLTGGSATVQLTGNASGQTITGGGGQMPSLTIAAGTHPVTLSGTLTVFGNYIVSSVGTFTSTGSTLGITGGGSSYTITPGTVSYNNVTINGNITTFDFGGGSMTIAGNLSLSPGNYNMTVNNGTLLVGGNLTLTNAYTTSGSVTVQLTGNASGQTITGGGGRMPNLTIAAGTHPVTLSGTLNVFGNYIVTSMGTFTSTGSTLVIQGGAATYTLTPGTVSYNDVTISGSSSTFDLGGGTMTIAGNLSLTPDNYNMTLNSGTLSVGGTTTTATNTSFGSAIVKLSGNASGQTIGGGGTLPNLTLATAANPATTLSANTGINTTMTSTSGNLLMSGHNLTIGTTLTLGGHTITKGGGVLTVNGSTVGTGSLFGGTIN